MTVRIDGTNSTANPAITGADTDTGLQFGTDEIQFVTGGTNRATVESDGDFTVEQGDLNLSDGNLVVASGHGIDFSATANGSGTMTSELLDDYEEGTWTPVIRGSTTAGSMTAGSTFGEYTKIGRTVFIKVRFEAITFSGSTGALEIRGLPFSDTGSNVIPSFAAGMFYNIVFDNTEIPGFYISGTSIWGIVSRSGTTWVNWSSSDFHSSTIYMSQALTYTTA